MQPMSPLTSGLMHSKGPSLVQRTCVKNKSYQLFLGPDRWYYEELSFVVRVAELSGTVPRVTLRHPFKQELLRTRFHVSADQASAI